MAREAMIGLGVHSARTPAMRTPGRYASGMLPRTLKTSLGNSKVAARLRARQFQGSDRYWEERYATGGTSGAGSYGVAAQWKAEVVNGWVAQYGISSIVDLGCGDGNQLGLAEYPRYLGLDRSESAIKRCITMFAGDDSKSFLRYDPETTSDDAGWLRGDAALSLEVIFHLVEDAVRVDYLHRLFQSADRFVIVCSSDRAGIQQGPHERHEPFTPWVSSNAPDWRLISKEAPPAEADLVSELFLFARRGN